MKSFKDHIKSELDEYRQTLEQFSRLFSMRQCIYCVLINNKNEMRMFKVKDDNTLNEFSKQLKGEIIRDVDPVQTIVKSATKANKDIPFGHIISLLTMFGGFQVLQHYTPTSFIRESCSVTVVDRENKVYPGTHH